MPLTTLITGTINLSNWTERTIQECILELEKKKISYEYYDFLYLICYVKTDKKYLFGKMLKLRKSQVEESFDLDSWELKTDYIDKKRVYSQIRFLITKDGRFVMEERTPYLSKGQFQTVLQELFHKVVEATVTLDMGYKTDIKELKDFIQAADVITHIEFDRMRVSNPIRTKGIENIESIIRAKVRKLNLASQSGQSIDTEEESIAAGIELSNEGYADAKIQGTIKGTRAVFSSRKRILKKKVEIDDDDEFVGEAKNLLE